MKKLLFCFYEGSIDAHLENLQRFDDDDFEVHVFDNVNDEILKEFNLENIFYNVLGEKYDEKSINIISNIENLIFDLFKEYSFKYNSFIFDNIYLNDCINKFILVEKDYLSCEYNFNFYCLSELDEDIDYIFLDNTDLYGFSLKKVENFIKSAREIYKDADFIVKYYENMSFKSRVLKEYIKNLDFENKKNAEKLFLEELNNQNILYVIYILSFLIYAFKERVYGDKLLNILLNTNLLDKNNKFFIIYQIISVSFTDADIRGSLDNEKMHNLYTQIFNDFEKAVGKQDFIPKEERHEDIIIVFISQFLGVEHGPTKTVLDRCYNLIKNMNKTVLLINTKEMITIKGLILMDNLGEGSVIEEYSKQKYYIYKDIEIPFYQPECSMPDEFECMKILNIIKKYKPYFILNIGGYSIIADLCSRLVPMATISTSGNYSISENKGQFFIIGRNVTEDDYRQAERLGYKRESVIESPFTFALKEQKNSYDRSDFDLPKDKFIIAIIGGRLQNEIDEEFLSMLDELSIEGCFIVFIGVFEFSSEMSYKYKSLNKNYKNLGFQKDILACIDLVDFYLNPRRQGGGTSAIECMFKGKPALSLNNGDVSVLVDKEFLIKDYDEMIELTIRCKNDENFYKIMSEKAKLKSKELMDTENNLKKMHYDIVNNPLFE